MANYEIVHNDVIEWAKGYTGEKFHAMLTDCPYHLTSITKRFGRADSAPAKGDVYRRASAGFMNQVWDGGGISFQPETWAALSQHLYPGAFIMAFAGTRGYHRMACAMEDAGLIIHPAMGWLTLCLSEDTEILTDQGWQSYDRLLAGSTCLCYNVDSNELSYLPIEEVYIYDHDDTAYRIQSDRTDQIVTPNHRVIVERDGELVFREARSLERQESVPILEAVPGLRQAVFSNEQRSISQKANLLQAVRLQDDRAKSPSKRTEAQAQGANNILRRLWKTGIQDSGPFKEDKNSNLFQALQWLFKKSKFNPGGAQALDRGAQATGPGTNEGGKQSGLERWSNLLQDAWQLYKRQVCKVPRRIFGNGPQGWVYNGASADSGSTPGAAFEAVRGSTSRQPQSSRQPIRESNAIQQQLSTQEIRGNRRPSTTLATVTPIYYKGKVWCVRTPTGAFVARRNGHIFITGNSGFPKATRIDTQIDKVAGVQQEIIGKGTSGEALRHSGENPRPWHENYKNDKGRIEYDITAPATPLARDWAGHRYGLQALKPAFEFIAVAQVPYSGRPVENIVSTGAGALNIEQSRIRLNGDKIPTGSGRGFRTDKFVGSIGRRELTQGPTEGSKNGRWPSNFILQHSPLDNGTCHPDCPVCLFDEQAGERPAGSSTTGNEPSEPTKNVYGKRNRVAWDSYGDSGPASRMFFQATWQYEVAEQLANAEPVRYEPKSSRAERDAGLEGFERKATKWQREEAGVLAQGKNPKTGERSGNLITPALNSHPTVKPLSLAIYLSRLLAPPAAYAPRRILIPFSGSGSEIIGAILSGGFEEIIGIETEANYVKIAEARCSWWSQWPGWGQTDVEAILKADEENKQQLSFL